MTAVERGIGDEDPAHAFEENVIVHRDARGTAYRRGAFDEIGKQRRPVKHRDRAH